METVGGDKVDEKLKPCPFCGADVENGVHIDVVVSFDELEDDTHYGCLLYTSPSPRD